MYMEIFFVVVVIFAVIGIGWAIYELFNEGMGTDHVLTGGVVVDK